MVTDLLHLSDALPAALAVVLGLVLLLAGRRLAWMAVGVAGFLAVFSFFAPSPRGLELLIAVLVGLLGALLAVVLTRLAVGVAGFVVGGWLAAAVAAAFGYGGEAWLPFVVGGIPGALLAAGVFELALVAASALLGAALLLGVALDGGAVPPGLALLGWLALAAAGMGAQLLTRRERRFAPGIPPPRTRYGGDYRASSGTQRRPPSPT
ncbi:MAG TPA: hypothetical protein VHQ65_05485 [Thermoanaerobaculia bacterium]|nr:hypothetical protein [Thermoanaerobaculia bacterium]